MESTASRNVESHSTRSRRLARFCSRGVAFGILSYVVGYSLVASLFVVGPASIEKASLGERLTWFGFAFYNAHFIPIAIGDLTHNYVTQPADSAVPNVVYHAIPLVTLAMGGAAFAARNRIEAAVETVVYSGASIAVGYALMAVLGALLFTIPAPGAMTARPDVVKAAALGGAYPVVLATLGALLVTVYRRT